MVLAALSLFRRSKMIELLNFVFSSFWTWLGTMMLIGAVSGGITGATISILIALRINRQG